jgi:hypothetical protein
MLNFKDFISEKLNNDEVLDLYNHFIRILLIHENYFYKENRISKDINFRNDINKVFHKLILGKKTFTEELYNKVSEYERKLYNDSKMTPDDNFGCSLWDVCDVILEDPDTLNINRYIQDFSENNIYVDIKNPYNYDDINTTISGLDKKITTLDKCEELVDSAFEIAKEKYDDEIDIINYAIKILYKYIKEYPELSEELKQQIEDWEDMKSRF